MAIMIPDRPPSVDHFTGSERDGWKKLEERLSDEFYTYHRLLYLRTNARQSEVDFLVVHRKKGMFNIECKGGGMYRDENGIQGSRKQRTPIAKARQSNQRRRLSVERPQNQPQGNNEFKVGNRISEVRSRKGPIAAMGWLYAVCRAKLVEMAESRINPRTHILLSDFRDPILFSSFPFSFFVVVPPRKLS